MDYAACAGSVVLGTPGVRTCLVLSTDGSPLAAYPPGDEAEATAVWARLGSLGPVTRGFVTMRSEVWAFVQGERYGALVLADRTVRPGQVLEIVDQALAEIAAAAVLAGGTDRRVEGATGQRERSAGRRFRLPLHPDEREPETRPTAELEPALAEAEQTGSAFEAAANIVITTEGSPSEAPSQEPEDVPAPESALAPSAAGEGIDTDDGDGTDVATDRRRRRGRGGAEVDIIALAREFAGLVSERDDGTR